MTTPDDQKYRPLGPDEVIQEGDECKRPSEWRKCTISIGRNPKKWPEFEFRRPIPAEAERKEQCTRCGNMVSDWVDPDWAKGRICRTCETKYDPSIPANELRAKLAEAEKEVKRLKDACSRTEHEVQQIAGKALNYPWSKDDQKNFPGATEADGVCVGGHVAASIVSELANKYAELQERIGPIGPGGEDRIDVLESSFEHLNFRVSESEKKRAEAEERVSMLESSIRDRHETYKFGGDVMNSIVLKRVDKMLPGEIAINALYRWVFERDDFKQRAETAERERDEAAYRWDSETCHRCNYMRSPVVPCKCGQLVVRGMADHIRAERDRLQSELDAIKNASGQFEPHHNFKTVIDGIHHMRHKIGEFTHQITSLQSELAKCREALKDSHDSLRIAEVHLGWGDCSLENVHNIVRKSIDQAKAALEGGK